MRVPVLISAILNIQNEVLHIAFVLVPKCGIALVVGTNGL